MDEQALAALKRRIADAVKAKAAAQPVPKDDKIVQAVKPVSMRGQVIGSYGHANAVLAVERRNVAPDWASLDDEALLAKAVEIIGNLNTCVTEMPDFTAYVAPDGHRCNIGCGDHGHERDFWMCLDTVGHEWKRLDQLREQLDTVLKGE
jgi:hypothetical protein